MKKEQKNYLFKVKTIEDIEDIPKGSGIYVKKELKKDYVGEWPAMCKTYNVKVPKDKCVKLDKI